ncbi:MAG: ABC transporter permease [Ardenticatenaceae bacterium]|nr:ABC transporter permease [Ardenticatenaceae bacterium]
MSDKQTENESRIATPGSGSPVWWIVFRRELAELWIGGRALQLIILFSIFLGIMSFVLASNSELSLIPPKEMVYLTLGAAINVGLFIALIIGADSISGERERATLEALLLTPASRRQIVVGKFLAAVSPWPAAFAISCPYLAVLSQGDEVLGQALLWGAVLGTLLAPAFTGFGMLVSIWSNSNKTSLFASLTLYVLFLLPTQFPGTAQTGAMGKLLKQVNPMEATNHFLEKTLVNNRGLDEVGYFLLTPALFATLILGLLFLYAAPRLRLDGGIPGLIRRRPGCVVGLFLIACLIVAPGTLPALAFQGETSTDPELPLQISIDMNYRVVKTGDKIEFNTLVTYSGTEEESAPLIVAMNITNLDGEGDPVDPEDWSPERAQYIEPLAPGESANLSWRVNAILEGDYMLYMVVIPEPDGPEETSQPVASSGIHLTVNPFTRLNPGGVLPFSIVIPVVLVLGMALLLWLRRRRLDTSSSR